MTSPFTNEIDKHLDRRVELRLEIDRLEAAIQRIRELHEQIPGPHDNLTCKACAINAEIYPDFPCPTIKALEGKQ